MDSATGLKLLAVAAVGALLSLDRRAAFQVMLSHPIVAATLVGIMLGTVQTGIAVAVLVGVLWSGALPVGGVIPPDETLAAIVAAAVAGVAARGPGLDLGAAVAGVLVGIPAGWIGRRVELALRRYNGELGREVERRVRAGEIRAVNRVTMRALATALAASFATCAIVLAIAVPLVHAALARFPEADHVLARAAYPVPFAGLGGVVSGAGFRIGIAWAALGFAIGLLLVGGIRLA